MIPLGFALDVLGGVNGGLVLGVDNIPVEEGFVGALIDEIARDYDDALALADGNGAGLNDRLAGEIALGGYQRPGAVQGAVIARQGGAREQERRQDGSGNCSRKVGPHDFLPGGVRARVGPFK